MFVLLFAVSNSGTIAYMLIYFYEVHVLNDQ